MPNRQTWALSLRYVDPSGTTQLWNADIKVYFEDEQKSMAYFDADTIKWWDELNEYGLSDDELRWYEDYKTNLKRTLEGLTLLPSDIKKKEFTVNRISAYRRERNTSPISLS